MIARVLPWSAGALLAAAAASQCTNPFVPQAPLAGTDGTVLAMVDWDPDGTGPLPPVVVVGGSFRVAGGVSSPGIALYDPASRQWSALGGGAGNGPSQVPEVHALAVLPNGDLIVGGTFQTVGGTPAASIARWNGSSWSALGSGIAGAVFAVAALPNGDVIACGGFVAAGGVAASNVARWNGSAWSPLGGGLDGDARAVTVMPNGDVVCAGQFAFAGGTPAASIARWNGSTWSPLGVGLGGEGYALELLPNGDLLAGGGFAAAGGNPAASRIARWDGSTWSPLGNGTDVLVRAITRLPNGDIVAAGAFTSAGGVAANGIARWDGSAWSPLGPGLGAQVLAMRPLPGGELLAGGSFPEQASGSRWLARWTGTAWTDATPGTNGAVEALAVLPNGDLVAAGGFTRIGGIAASRVARRSGGAWSPLGGGTDALVRSAVALSGGDVVVGGDFTTAGGVPAQRIARWNGTAWAALGAGLPGPVYALGVRPNGDVIAAGAFSQGVMRWDGVSWSPMGMQALVVSGFALRALAVAPNGDVFVGGLLAMVGSSIGSVWRWDGATWSALPAPGVAGGIHAFAAAANGDLLATGQLNGGVFGRWNGTAWTVSGVAVPASSWPARGTVIELPNGDVVVGGAFASVGGVTASCVARWDGSAWSTFGNGANGNVAAAAVLPGGDLVVGGQFTNASGAAYVAQVTTTCAATAAPFGNGCAGSGGTNVLGATALPWLGGVHRARATGLPASCIAVRVLGVAALAVPLSAVLPQGLPGCTLLVTPDALDAYVPTGGVLDAALPIPDALPLLGAVLREQVAALELGSNGAIVALSSTNGLTLVLGSF